jgi:enediyne biosynthesis protein E5
MISDPNTTPDSRLGRILFAVLIAVGAAYVQFGLNRTNGLLADALLAPDTDNRFPPAWNKISLRLSNNISGITWSYP